MSLILRSRLIMAGALAGAVWFAWLLASGEYVWPVIAGSLMLSASVIVALRVPLGAIAVGTLLFGYIVGNRGFAQLMISPRLPLLPAELGLLLAGGWAAIECARQQTLPFRRDALNGCILAWLILGTARVLFDLGPFGFVAVRDYAMIYYAAFFFITQQIASGDGRRFLLRALLAASIAQPIAAVLVEAFPEFFLTTFAVRGVPLIYFKGDLALTFTAVSAFLLFFNVRGGHRFWAWPLATLELLFVITGANRASMLGAVVALGWLAMSRARRFVWTQFGMLAAALLVVGGLAVLLENSWAERKLDSVVERVASVGDFMGRGTYVTEESGMKGDNNRFRAVWWRTVVTDTLDQNPVFGFGFGHDLARNFLREYDPDMIEEFTARSPHSIVVSVIGRMGFSGLLVFLILLATIVVRTWRVVRHPETDATTVGLWASIWVILVSACFGVVLEGPMGAVVFWCLLGFAHAFSVAARPVEVDEIGIEAGAALQRATFHDEVPVPHSRFT